MADSTEGDEGGGELPLLPGGEGGGKCRSDSYSTLHTTFTNSSPSVSLPSQLMCESR